MSLTLSGGTIVASLAPVAVVEGDVVVEGDRVTAVEGGYWHDEPCCMGDMQGPGALCWHSTDELK